MNRVEETEQLQISNNLEGVVELSNGARGTTEMEFGNENEIDLLTHRLQKLRIDSRESTPSTNRGKKKNKGRRSVRVKLSEEIEAVNSNGSPNAETSGMGRKNGRRGSGENNDNQHNHNNDKKQSNVNETLPAKGIDQTEEEIERQKFREEFQKLREFTIAKLARESKKEVHISSRNSTIKTLYDFSVMPAVYKWTPPSHQLNEIVKVRMQDPSNMSYPIDVLKFHYTDKDKLLEFEESLTSMNAVYKSLGQVTNEHILTSGYIVPGYVAVIWIDGLFKRALILEVVRDPRDQVKKAKCYLFDEASVGMVKLRHVYRAVTEYCKLPPKIIKFRLAGLRRYGDTAEYRHLLGRLMAAENTMADGSFDLTAKIVSLKPDGNKIILTSSKYPNQSINEVILTCLFSTFDMPVLLKTRDFYPSLRIASCRKNAEMMIQLNTPVFQHLQDLLSNNENNRQEFGQRKTRGLIEKNELYVYKDDVYGTCFRVLCTSNRLQRETDYVRILYIDFGVRGMVNKWNLAHVNHLRSKNLPFNPLTMIPAQCVLVHLAGIASVDRLEFYPLFADENSFWLKKIENVTENSTSNANVIDEVELFANFLETMAPGQSMTLNKLAIWTQIGTEKVPGPPCYCMDNFSSIPSVESEGVNWHFRKSKRPRPLELCELIDIVIIGSVKPGEFFVRSRISHIEHVLFQIHKRCESYLAKNVKVEQWCGCDLVGRDFVVQAVIDFRNYFYRVRVLGKSISAGGDAHPINMERVDCLFLDICEVRTVPVADLQRMDPSVAEIPVQGARAVWSCNGWQWEADDWNRLMHYAIYRHFKARVLTIKEHKSGSVEFDINLYKVGRKLTFAGLLLRPKDRFWEHGLD